MNNLILEDTIAAISTPAGSGAISIVRMSGNQTFEIVKKIFKTKEMFEEIDSWRAVFGKIFDDKDLVDEVVLIKYVSPNSYTKEDMVEINCHGGVYVTRRILELLLDKGARAAQPGEFTLRAFLNGRIDLSRAEAVSDLIQSQTEIGLKTSLSQLEGKLATRIREIRDLIVDSTSLLELELDFSDEDVEFVSRKDLLKEIENIIQELKDLISTYQAGRIAREGVKLVIAGKPNVGKSSLLNRLVNDERAIVTDIPGTTRDALEVQLDMQGVLFRIVDTAGLIETNDPVEKEGVVRAKKHLQSADIIIHLFDGANELDESDFEIINEIEKLSDKIVFDVVNKADLPQKIGKLANIQNSGQILSISALTGTGIKQLEELMLHSVLDEEKLYSEQTIITSARHFNILKKAMNDLKCAAQETRKNVSSEFVSVYLRDALDSLGEIIGSVTNEDILNNVFSKFCIGK